DGGPHRGVTVGAGLTDLGVAPFQRGEHGLDVAGVQLLDGNVAQVWDEVEAQVVVIAAHGLLGQAAAAGQPGGQVLRGGGRHRGGYAGADVAGRGVAVG